MRIIGGNNAGLRINPTKLKLRPTTDRSKEALFNILYNKVDYDNVSVLDLFSGTGNISYEFASRGAKSIYAIEKNNKSVEFIKDFNKKNNFDINVIRKDVFSFIKQTKMSFDVIFADPPYDINEIKYYELISLIYNRKLINDGGLFIIEHASKITLDKHIFFSNTRKYGDSSFSFYINLNNWLSLFSL